MACVCPQCGREALDLGGTPGGFPHQFHCQTCGRVGIEPVSLKHFLHTDGQGFAVDPQPKPGTNIRWACGIVPGCTHETQADAEKHRRSHL
jgi:hypothetical protein